MNGDNVGVLSCDQICSSTDRAVQQQQQDCHYRGLARMQQHPPASTQHNTHKHQHTNIQIPVSGIKSDVELLQCSTDYDHQST